MNATPFFERLALKTTTFVISALEIVGAGLLIGLSAHVKIPLLFTPIPLTLQTLAVLLIGSFLGSKKGAAAVISYLAMGALGLPLFAGGQPAISYLTGSAAGYLVGLVAQAYLAGLFFEKVRQPSIYKTFLIFAVTTLLQLGLGASWLALFVGSEHALMMGIAPFLAGDLLKCLIAAGIYRSLPQKQN